MQYWGEGLFFFFVYSSNFAAEDTIPLQCSLGGKFQDNKFGFSGILALDGYSFDAALNLSVIPLSFRIFSLELAYNNHIAKTILTEFNPKVIQLDNAFLCNFKFENKAKAEPFFTKIGLGINISNHWQKLSSRTLEMKKNYMLIEIQLKKSFAKKHEIMFRLATYDPLYFNTLLSTWWQLGYSYVLTKNTTMGTLVEVLYTDQFVLSGTINGFQGKLFVAYRW